MSKTEIEKSVDEILARVLPEVEERARRLLKSNAVNPEDSRPAWIGKAIVCAALLDMSGMWSARESDKEWYAEVENLRCF